MKTAVRLATTDDADAIALLCHALWPDATTRQHAAELKPILGGHPHSTLPLVVFVAQTDTGALVGFIEVGLRSHADGCDPAHPVGFLEGWYVVPEYRRKRVGASLIAAAEQWAKAQGCREIASDTWLDNPDSEAAHQALGYEVVDRCIHFRKSL